MLVFKLTHELRSSPIGCDVCREEIKMRVRIFPLDSFARLRANNLNHILILNHEGEKSKWVTCNIEGYNILAYWNQFRNVKTDWLSLWWINIFNWFSLRCFLVRLSIPEMFEHCNCNINARLLNCHEILSLAQIGLCMIKITSNCIIHRWTIFPWHHRLLCKHIR